MWSLPMPQYDPATMRAVALAYGRESEAGRLDGPARKGAGRFIAWAAQEHPAWFWKGVSLPERR